MPGFNWLKGKIENCYEPTGSMVKPGPEVRCNRRLWNVFFTTPSSLQKINNPLLSKEIIINDLSTHNHYLQKSE
jgi:hypothetical protein